MGEALGRNIGRGATQRAARIEHRSFGHHLNLLLQRARSGGAFDAAATFDQAVIATRPLDGIGRGGRKEREKPLASGAGFGEAGGRGSGGSGVAATAPVN